MSSSIGEKKDIALLSINVIRALYIFNGTCQDFMKCH